jgi:hypothetical protein
LKHILNEPWNGHFKTLGRQPLFQDIQVESAARLFKVLMRCAGISGFFQLAQ